MNTSEFRVVFYSHDSLGMGHVRRNLALAHHLSEVCADRTGQQVTGLLISSLSAASVFPLPQGFDWLFLPGIKKSPAGYIPRRSNLEPDEFIDMRSQILEGALLSFRPNLIVVDRHLYGVDNELKAPLAKLRELNPDVHIVLGMREVLDDPAQTVAEWKSLGEADEVKEVIDSLWIYGDQDVYDPLASGEIPAYLADRIEYTGYLSHGRRIIDRNVDAADVGLPNKPFILTTAGGGSDGYDLLKAAVEMKVPNGYNHLVVTGPQLSDAGFLHLKNTAHASTRVVHSWPGLSRLIDQASAVISMGGYNTTSEILATSTPALIVPREVPRIEQLIRARALAESKAIDYLPKQELSPQALESWLAGALSQRVDRSHVALDGLRQAAKLATNALVRSASPAVLL